MMKKEKELLVAVASQKGGVGKSVFTVLLASVLHYRKGLRQICAVHYRTAHS